MGCYIWYSEELISGLGAQAPPRCTKYNSPPINCHCTDHCIAAWSVTLCGFNAGIKGLKLGARYMELQK